MTDKERLESRWREVNKALERLADLRVLPPGMDRAEAEGRLLEELDEIEYEVGYEIGQ